MPKDVQGRAKLLVKDEGIITGVEFAKMIYSCVDSKIVTPSLFVIIFIFSRVIRWRLF
ncbi:MAG TPA: hypothetical protein DDZ41_10355 [Flavobacterium sp.]|nr:hypothetical protein [Flavobacterium sp.]